MVGIPRLKVRKMLITAGSYETDVSHEKSTNAERHHVFCYQKACMEPLKFATQSIPEAGRKITGPKQIGTFGATL